MNRLTRLAVLLVATGLLLIPAKTFGPARAATSLGPFVSVSLAALHIGATERVVGFDFEVASGRIAQITDIPIGWNISVDNDPSWNTKIHASLQVAAAALDDSFFKEFVVIEKELNAKSPFEIVGKVVVSTDFSKVREIQVGMKDFTIRDNAQFLKRQLSN